MRETKGLWYFERMIIKYVLKNNIYIYIHTHTRIERSKQGDKELVGALGFFF